MRCDFFFGVQICLKFLSQLFLFLGEIKIEKKYLFDIFLGGPKFFRNFLSHFFLFLGEIEIEKK